MKTADRAQDGPKDVHGGEGARCGLPPVGRKVSEVVTSARRGVTNLVTPNSAIQGAEFAAFPRACVTSHESHGSGT
jgi:hypothetical protein